MLRFEVEIRTFCNTSAPQEKAGYHHHLYVLHTSHHQESLKSSEIEKWKIEITIFEAGSHRVVHAGLKLRPLPVFAFWILGLKIQELGGGGEDMPLIPAFIPLHAENSLPALGSCSFGGPLLGFCKCLDYLSWATWALCFQSAWWATFLSLDPNLHIEGC